MTETNVPRLRFSGFSVEWKKLSVKDIGTIVTGNTPSKKDKSNYGGENVWITPSDIDVNSTYLKDSSTKLSEKGKEISRIIPRDSVLVTCIASIGKNALSDCELSINQQINAVIPNEKFNPYFLLNLSNQWSIEMNRLTSNASLKIINRTEFSKLETLAPELKEQERIGSFFAKIDKIIELQAQKLEQLKKLKQGYLQKIFPQDGESVPRLRFSVFSGEWKNKKIGDISSSSKGNGLSKDNINEDRQGFPVVHYADIYKFQNIVSDVIHWSEKDEGKIIPNNSVIFPMSDVTPNGLAKCSVVKVQDVKAGGDVLIFSMKQEISAEYISYFISANKKKILRLVSGTSVKHISSKSVNKVDILLPNLSEQNKISEFFNKLDQMINNQSDKIDELKQQKKAYLQKMFI